MGRRRTLKRYEIFNLLDTMGTFKQKMTFVSVLIAMETRPPEKTNK